MRVCSSGGCRWCDQGDGASRTGMDPIIKTEHKIMAQTNNELLMAAHENCYHADVGLKAIFQAGLANPVPAAEFTVVLVKLRAATAAVTELERRAQGGEPVKDGD